MMKGIGHIFVLSMIMIYAPSLGQGWKTYPYTPEGSLLSFPLDEGRHDGERIEWWYISGQLKGEVTGNEYSYMISYFYYPIYGYDGFRIFNLSNENSGVFYRDTSPLIYHELGADSLNIQATIVPEIKEYWQNRTDDNGHMIPFEYILSVSTEQDSLTLQLESLKPPLILGDSGLFNQGASSYTYYFSLTKNSVTGDISIHGTQEPVSGAAWIDRQFGSFNPLTQEDYEWFSIQLSNEMDINLWNIFTRSGEIPLTSAYRIMSLYLDEETQLTTSDFQIERLSYDYMPDSARCYAQQWRLTSPVLDLDLMITTRHHNSEVQLPFRFFEGSTHIEGTVDGLQVTGKGFAELLHSYEKPVITLSYPVGSYWNSIRPIAWHLDNPDEGRPLKYDLACSIDHKQTFFTLAQALTDPLFYWNNPDISEGDSCWFKITAYSIDTTLQRIIISDSPSIFNPNLTPVNLNDQEPVNDRRIHVYPIPAESDLMIDLPENHLFSRLQVMDVFGRTIFEKNISHQYKIEIQTADMASGVYLIGLWHESKMSVVKFLVR